MVCGSSIPGIYSMGGDLRLFETLVRSQDRPGADRLCDACIDLVYANYINLGLPVVTISLVQGDALGGGFEAALSGNVVVAERSAKFGLPECLFNLFPGMGAYSLISRRIGAVEAERMILSGRIYSAEELFEIGLVDISPKTAKASARSGTTSTSTTGSMRCAVRSTRRAGGSIPWTYEELHDITMIWVDTVLEMSPMDLKKMAVWPRPRIVAAAWWKPGPRVRPVSGAAVRRSFDRLEGLGRNSSPSCSRRYCVSASRHSSNSLRIFSA